jgi:3,4-dihydroxy 2-butanone 4-phosphate synthase/GTP cyclohydrolase II
MNPAVMASRLRAGETIVLIAAHEDSGCLVFSAECATTALMSFMVRHTAGYITVAITRTDAGRMGLPPMCAAFEMPDSPQHAVAVDAAAGVTTGISAADRAQTARELARKSATPQDFRRPGHVIPIVVPPREHRRQVGTAEAGVDLMDLAGLAPAAVMCELVSDSGPTEMANSEELRAFALLHGLACVTVTEVAGEIREVWPT